MPISDILNSTRDSNNITAIRELQASYRKTASQAVEPNSPRHQSFAELGEQAKEFNKIREDLIMLEAYKTSAPIAESRLEKEFLALENIKKAITNVRKEMADNIHGAQGTSADIADRALVRIREILNTQNNGQYLFGGVNSTTEPCGDLVPAGNNNIVAGVITTNYTTAAPNPIRFKVSSTHTAEAGIDASNEAFAQTIAAMNKLKVGKPPIGPERALTQAELADVETTLTRAESLLDQLMVKNGRAKDIIKDAAEYNKSVEIEANERMGSTFEIGPAEAASHLNNAQMALLLAFKVEATTTRLFEKLLN